MNREMLWFCAPIILISSSHKPNRLEYIKAEADRIHLQFQLVLYKQGPAGTHSPVTIINRAPNYIFMKHYSVFYVPCHSIHITSAHEMQEEKYSSASNRKTANCIRKPEMFPKSQNEKQCKKTFCRISRE